MAGRKRKNHRLTPERLMYSRPCKLHNHHNADGYSVRVISGPCVACHEGLPPGLTDIQVEGITKRIPVLNRMSDEERRLGHIKQQKAWNQRNADKVRGYVKKYDAKPERKEKGAKDTLERYHALTLEERRVRNELTYSKFKEKMQDPEFRELQRLKRKAKYDARTPEEIEKHVLAQRNYRIPKDQR